MTDAGQQDMSGLFRGTDGTHPEPKGRAADWTEETSEPASERRGKLGGSSAPEAQSNTDPKSGRGISATSIPAFVAGAELADLADTDERIVVLTADLAHANRTIDFGARHPGRFFNVGVAEQNMVSIAAGMAASGLLPYAATFAAYVALLA